MGIFSQWRLNCQRYGQFFRKKKKKSCGFQTVQARYLSEYGQFGSPYHAILFIVQLSE